MGEETTKVAAVGRIEVASKLLEIGRKTLEWEVIEAQMTAEIDAVKARYSSRLETRLATIQGLEAELEAACNSSRGGLLRKGKKSLRTLFGAVKWLLTPDRIGTMRGINADQATENLVRRGHEGLVRIRKEPDKPGVKEAFAAGRIDDAELRACGLVVKLGEERFDYDLDRERIAERLKDEG